MVVISFLFLLLIISYEVYYTWIASSAFRPAFLAIKILLLFLCACVSLFSIKKLNLLVAAFDKWLLLMYMLFVFASATFSKSPFYVFVYSVMLLGLLFFALNVSAQIVLWEKKKILKSLCYILCVFIAISLIGNFLNLDKFYYFDVWGSRRVQGVYVEPAKLAQVSAISAIVAWFLIKKKIIKTMIIFCSVLAIYLAGNRSYMLAVLILSYLVIIRRLKIGMRGSLIIGLMSISIILMAVNIIGVTNLEKIPYLRFHSLDTLSGRSDLWNKSIEAATKRITGMGYTIGGSVLYEANNTNILSTSKNREFNFSESNAAGKQTLHNGYIQALCDLGPLGAICYIMVFLRGLFFAFKTRIIVLNDAISFLFLFFFLVNFSATILISPTEINTLIFWVSWFGLMLRYNHLRGKINGPTKRYQLTN